MRKLLIVFVISVNLVSCVDKRKNEIEKAIILSENGDLIVDYQLLNTNHKVKRIIIKDDLLNQEQRLIIQDSSSLIKKIENLIDVNDDKEFLNTWTSFDYNGNAEIENSYFYTTHIGGTENNLFMLCYFPSSLYFSDKKAKKFILSGPYDDKFKLNDSKIDTIEFDSNNLAKIPIGKYSKGKNRIRFIIKEEGTKDDSRSTNSIYVDKFFHVQER